MSFTVRALVLVALTIPATAQPVHAEEVARPNILLLMADDATKQQMDQMPDIKRLIADQGTVHENAVAEYALCGPSRVTWMTGLFSHNHGIDCNKGAWARFRKTPGYRDNVGTRLQAAGYNSAFIGKNVNGAGGQFPAEVPPGWDHYCGLVGDSAYHYEPGRWKINCNGTVTVGKEYQTTALTNLAVDWVTEAAAGGPFFGAVTCLCPHSRSGSPYAIPATEHAGSHAGEKYRPPDFNTAGANTRPPAQRNAPLTATEIQQIDRAYPLALEALKSFDDMVEQLVAALSAAGELDNTIIIVTSDHGYFNGQKGIDKGKIHLYEPAIHIPLYVRGPGFGRGDVSHRLTVNADLTATILDAAGANMAGLDGIPLRSLFPSRAVPLYGIVPGTTKIYEGARAEGEVFWTVSGVAERYDLRTDPWQLRNLTTSATRWQLDAERQALIDQLRECVGAGCRVTYG